MKTTTRTHSFSIGDTFRVGESYGFEVAVAGRQGEVITARERTAFHLDRGCSGGVFEHWMSQPEVKVGDTVVVNDRTFALTQVDGFYGSGAYRMEEK